MSIINSRRLAHLLLKRNGFMLAAVRNHWNKDYKPGPYPKTQEERNKAAAKYGLLPSEYEPYPDDGSGLGDYPKLPDISTEAKDPYYPWDNPEFKRNFNEAVHANADIMGEDRYDVSARHRVPPWLQWTQFLGVLFGCACLMYISEQAKQFPALIPKQYPYTGKTHYTFEPRE